MMLNIIYPILNLKSKLRIKYLIQQTCEMNDTECEPSKKFARFVCEWRLHALKAFIESYVEFHTPSIEQRLFFYIKWMSSPRYVFYHSWTLLYLSYSFFNYYFFIFLFASYHMVSSSSYLPTCASQSHLYALYIYLSFIFVD